MGRVREDRHENQKVLEPLVRAQRAQHAKGIAAARRDMLGPAPHRVHRAPDPAVGTDGDRFGGLAPDGEVGAAVAHIG